MKDLALFDHCQYGEAFDGMARHVSEMSALDRIVFEDCDLVAGKVVAPHPNLKAYPHWLCPEYIAGRIGCDLPDAANLLDCWVILDATQDMIETFIRWTKARGVDKALAYFEKLAMALAELENIDPEDAMESDQPQYEAPDPYRYHTIGDYPDDDHTPWIKTQPRWFRNLVGRVRSCRDLVALARLGREGYQLDLSKTQAGVFWTEYNIKKAKLEGMIKLGPTARAFIARISKANGNLASLGAWLYKVQQGKAKVANPPCKHEWTLIWQAYHQRKAQHETQASLF